MSQRPSFPGGRERDSLALRSSIEFVASRDPAECDFDDGTLRIGQDGLATPGGNDFFGADRLQGADTVPVESWTVGDRTLAHLIVTTTYTPLSRRLYSHGATLDNLGLQSITCESGHLLARSLACIHAHAHARAHTHAHTRTHTPPSPFVS